MKLRQYLDTYSSETLKALARFCDAKSSLSTKAAMADHIAATMLSADQMREQWSKLSGVERRAVSYALYNDGEFQVTAFQAHYDELPDLPSPDYYWTGQPMTRLGLFMYRLHVPDDLIPLLRPLATKPEPFRVNGLGQAPEAVEVYGDDIALLRADTERAGQADLATLLSLVERREITLSTSSGLPTPAAGRRLLQALAEGDFLPDAEKVKITDTIRPVGLCAFARWGGLIEWSPYGDVKLSAAGREWLRDQKPELLLEAFERWQQAKGGDEVQRIFGLHGRQSKKVTFTSPALRRERIVEALSWCPAGEWIDIEDFFRGLLAWQLDFEIEEGEEGRLYVGPAWASEYYGSAFDYWRLVNGLYILAVLWETLASIGALDILYLLPGDADYDIDADFDIEGPFSLYDGLKYFRINDLGAYLFGQCDDYTPAAASRPPFLAADAGGLIRVAEPEHVTPADRLMLASFTTPDGEDTYRFDLDGLLGALAAKTNLEAARSFLARWLAGGLPAEMDRLFATAVERSQAFAAPEPAVTVKARDRELAALVSRDPKLKTFCRLSGEQTIVLPAGRLNALRKRLRELGYVLPE